MERKRESERKRREKIIHEIHYNELLDDSSLTQKEHLSTKKGHLSTEKGHFINQK